MKRLLSTLLALVLVLSACVPALAYTEKLNAPGTLPLVNSDVKLVIGTPAIATVTDYDDNHLTNWLREKTGIDIEVFLFDGSEYKTQLQLMTSAGETLPDTLWSFSLNELERESYGTQGYLVDLLPYFEEGELDYFFQNEALDFLTEKEKEITLKARLSSNGALYSFPFWSVDIADPWSSGFMINNTFCDALGMDIPSTTEEFYNYLVAVKTQDPNGNGLADEIPLVGYTYSSAWGDVVGILLNAFLYYPATWDGAALCCDDDGNIYVPYQKEEFKDGIRWIAQLYSEGLISDLSFSQDRYGLQAMTDLTGDAPDIVGAAASHRSLMFASHSTAERRTHYTSIGPLTGPNGVAYCPSYQAQPNAANFITTDCEYPEVAFALFDFMTTAEATLNARNGREGDADSGYWHWATEEEKAIGPLYADLGYSEVLYNGGPELAWGQQTNEIWNTASFCWRPMGFCALEPKTLSDNPISQYNSSDWANAIIARYGKAPKNLVGSLAYTAEELDQRGTAQTDIGIYVREMMTRFVTGEQDVDANWDEFQTNLELMGLSTILDCAQAAYDRMYK